MTFHSISRFLRDAIGSPAEEKSPANREAGLRTATAAILLEIAYADESLSMTEETALLGFLQKTFGIDEARARELMESADQVRNKTIDHFALTNYIRQNTSREQRLEIVRMMWALVYSDGQLHQYENYLVRKLSDLLAIEHAEMIELKLAAQRG